MKLWGAPATSESWTLSQSEPMVLSTTAPALQGGGVGCVFGKYEAVGGFPNGNFADVADAELALALA